MRFAGSNLSFTDFKHSVGVKAGQAAGLASLGDTFEATALLRRLTEKLHKTALQQEDMKSVQQ